MAPPEAKKPRKMLGPCVWWVRNDLRLQDNPGVRAVNGAALCDCRPFCAVYVFDPRDLGLGKDGAAKARFLLQSVLQLGEELAARNSKLYVAYGRPEDVLRMLPSGTELKCQNEPCSIDGVHTEEQVEKALLKAGSKLRRDPGAGWLYHPHEWPYGAKSPIGVGEYQDFPRTIEDLGKALGYKDIATSAERNPDAATIRPIVPAPSRFSPPFEGLLLPGLIPQEVLQDETKALQYFGYQADDIKESLAQQSYKGGEVSARALFDEPAAMVKNWKQVANYMAVGCISAREVFARAAESPNFGDVAHRLVSREFGKLHGEPDLKQEA